MATNPLKFIQQTRAEIAKVVWPSRREVTVTASMVLLLAVVAAVFFGLVDFGIREGMRALLAVVS